MILCFCKNDDLVLLDDAVDLRAALLQPIVQRRQHEFKKRTRLTCTPSARLDQQKLLRRLIRHPDTQRNTVTRLMKCRIAVSSGVRNTEFKTNDEKVTHLTTYTSFTMNILPRLTLTRRRQQSNITNSRFIISCIPLAFAGRIPTCLCRHAHYLPLQAYDIFSIEDAC